MKGLVLAFLLLAACHKPARPPLSVEAYVWQSPDRPAVKAAMGWATGTIDTFHIRAVEMKWSRGKFEIDRMVKKLPAPDCGLVVRIGASASQLDWTPSQVLAVADVIRELAALGPREIQKQLKINVLCVLWF